jgi:hypothetical protein
VWLVNTVKGVLTMVGIYTLKAWSFQTGPRLSGKPGISGVKSGDSAPPDSELKIFQGI